MTYVLVSEYERTNNDSSPVTIIANHSSFLVQVLQGVRTVPGPCNLSQVPLFMLIPICHTINDDSVSKTIIMDFLKYKHGMIEGVLNLARLRSTLSMIGRKRGTKIPHQIFMDEQLGLKNDPPRTRDHTRS
jgi:hypothetical protein